MPAKYEGSNRVCRGRAVSTGERIEVNFDSLITHVGPVSRPDEDDGTWLAPGFIDLQVNGFAGVDYNSPTASHEEIAHSIRVLFSTGVTRFFPTVITGAPDNMLGALRNLAAARELLPEGSAMEAFHVEGPHISPEDGPRGAHPARWVRPPDLDEFHRWQDAARGNVRLVTLSPEWPEALRYIESLVREGVIVSIGHTRATREQIQDAVSAGATLSTHLGNGAHMVLPRHPNYIWEQLANDRLAASFIADGIHLDDSFLRVALRAKGIERSILVTDAVMPAMCAPGPYKLGEVDVDLHNDGSVRLRDGNHLGGSSLRMDHGIGNLMRLAGLSLSEAVAMATINPASICRIRLFGIAPGERADMIRFRLENRNIHILATYFNGRPVFGDQMWSL